MPPCLSGAPVAQLDRASGFEPEGREFESLRARKLQKKFEHASAQAVPSDSSNLSGGRGRALLNAWAAAPCAGRLSCRNTRSFISDGIALLRVIKTNADKSRGEFRRPAS
jgi:hypothetical protein